MMTSDERRRILESFGRAPVLLTAALRQLPKKMWLYKPAPERWSIHEIILHLADSEASSYICCRRLIAEPGRDLADFDAARWAGTLGYFHQSTREALEIIRRLRSMTYHLVAVVPAPIWSRVVATPGGSITLEAWIQRQERHLPHHIEQMQENHDAWLLLHPQRRPAVRSAAMSISSPVSALSPQAC